MALLAAIARDIAELVRAGYPEETARRIATGELDIRPEARFERQLDLYPTIAYHGTSDDILNVDVNRASTGKTRDTGFFMSENPVIASSYAGLPRGVGDNVLPLAVNTQGFDLVDAGSSDWNRIINPDFLIGGERLATVGDLPMSYSTRSPDTPLFDPNNIVEFDTDELARTSRRLGSPGIVIKDVADIGPNYRAMTAALQAQTGLKRGDEGYQQALDTLYGNTIVASDPSRVRSLYSAAFDPEYTGSNILGTSAATAGALGLLAAPEEAEAGAKSQAAQEAIQGVMGMIDPRFDPRVRERERLAALTPAVSERGTLDDIPRIALSDLEGRQFITTMSDRTRAGGLLTGINDVEFDLPVNLQGGQDFMFENPGAVWASAPGVVGQIMREAYRSKDNPIYLPYRMAPTGGDFSKMTGEAMISYASANMTQAQKRELNKAIRGYVTKGKMVKQKDGPSKRVGDGLSIEGWQGVDSPASIEAWRNTPDSVRKELMDMMDKQFRNKGGLGIGEARLAVAEPYQVGLRDAGIQNVGLIFRDQPVIKESGHPSYPFAVPGEGLGRLDDQPMSIFDLIPDARLGEAQRRVGDTVDPLNPSASDIRAVSMKPYSGRIDEATLRRLEDRGVNVNSPAAVDAALMAMYAEDAHNIEVQNQMKALGLDRDPRYEYGNILPIKQDIVTGESSLAYPEIVRGLLGALIDLGNTPKTGVYNPNAILDIAL